VDAPLISWLCLFAFALPVLAAARRPQAVTRPMLLIACWFAFLVLQAGVSVVWSHYVDRTNNLVVSMVGLPIEATLVLGALAEWQVQPVARNTVRFFIPLYWMLWGIGIVLLESTASFSTFSGPVLGLLVLMASLFAFIGRLQRDDEPVLDTPWGWILPGLAIFFAINITSTIVSAYGMQRNDIALVVRAVLLKLYIYVFATSLITMGYVWPTRRMSSGRSSSPVPSP
jgi:hypothetical protein